MSMLSLCVLLFVAFNGVEGVMVDCEYVLEAMG